MREVEREREAEVGLQWDEGITHVVNDWVNVASQLYDRKRWHRQGECQTAASAGGYGGMIRLWAGHLYIEFGTALNKSQCRLKGFPFFSFNVKS